MRARFGHDIFSPDSGWVSRTDMITGNRREVPFKFVYCLKLLCSSYFCGRQVLLKGS